MIPNWAVLMALGAVPAGLLAQCGLRVPLFAPSDVVAGAIGTKGQGGTAFTIAASCPGDNNAHVKFKLDTTRTETNWLTVSPSSGTTPAEVHVGANLNTLPNSFPGGPVNVYLYFHIVDQPPPPIPNVIVKLIRTAPDPPVIRSVVNAASLVPVVTPGAVVLVRGHSMGPNLLASLDDQTGVYPTTLGQTAVTFDGIPAPILASNSGAIKVVAPYAIAGRSSVQVHVTHYPQTSLETTSPAFPVPVAESSLGIFTGPQRGVIPTEIQNCDADGCTPNSVDNPAPPGSIIMLFATGIARRIDPVADGSVPTYSRLYEPSRVKLTIGGRPAQLLYCGAAPYQVWGVFQVNAIVPEGIGSGPQPIVLTVEQASSASQLATAVVK